jgi:uncharacterized membrane protein
MAELAPTQSERRPLAIALAAAATLVTLLALDLTFLGIVARGFYDAALGPLKGEVVLPAAGLFYAMYVAAIVAYAVLGAANPTAARWRGAGLGFVAYATYELTNWSVVRGWPVQLVPVDIGWGVVLTAIAAGVGKWVHDRVSRR